MEQATVPARTEASRDEVIAGWAASGVLSRQIAAAWARELQDQDRDQEAGRPADSSMKVAAQRGVNNSTAARARLLLVGAWFPRQRADRHYYYVYAT